LSQGAKVRGARREKKRKAGPISQQGKREGKKLRTCKKMGCKVNGPSYRDGVPVPPRGRAIHSSGSNAVTLVFARKGKGPVQQKKKGSPFPGNNSNRHQKEKGRDPPEPGRRKEKPDPIQEKKHHQEPLSREKESQLPELAADKKREKACCRYCGENGTKPRQSNVPKNIQQKGKGGLLVLTRKKKKISTGSLEK